jgi:hypothetical protein
MEEYKKYLGQVVATRGVGSGVNVGKLAYFDCDNKIVILSDSYFLRSWKYLKSYGSMTSLSSGDIVDGEITKIHNDTIITDVAQIVVCPESILAICKKVAK